MSNISSGSSTPSSSTSSASVVPDDFPFATCPDKRDVAAKSLQYQRLERALDLTAYTKQIEQLLSRPINNIKGREWVRDLILDESDSEEDGGQEVSQKELKAVLKLHKYQKKLRAKAKGEGLSNSQYAYYSAGLISAQKEEKKSTFQDSYNDGSRRNKPVEVNVSALNTLAAASTPIAPKTSPNPSIVHTGPHPDDAPEPLSVDANFSSSTIIPLPPLSH